MRPAVVELLAARDGQPAIGRRHRSLRVGSAAAVALLALASCLFAGRPRRDKDVYHDVLVLGRIFPKSGFVALTEDLATDYPLKNYLARWDFLGAESIPQPQLYLVGRADARTFPSGYVEVPTAMSRYRLYRRMPVTASSRSP